VSVGLLTRDLVDGILQGMSQQNVDRCRRMSASFNRSDTEAMLACWHPDGEWRDLMHAPDTPERVQGVAAIRTLMQQWTEAFDDFHCRGR
jgi:ketosteroid isomerase-like protein